ncbi:MAG TPA: chemotaxis-specific protein-glutamate methyltransferase CheB [Anaeromyxobacter sp.]
MTRATPPPRNVRVLLVDDSATSRAAMERILVADCGATVVGTAANGEEALGEALRLTPDLVFLDLEMPRMDGFTFLRLLMARRPTPVVVVSAQSGRSDVFKALELGALDFVAKPYGGGPLETLRSALVEKCQLLRCLRMENLVGPGEGAAPRAHEARIAEPGGVVAIGASTGGPQAIQRLLSELPGTLPAGIVVAQHMPERFTAAFAERLGRTTPFSVQEATDGDVVAAGRVLVAPGGRVLEVRRDGAGTLRAAVLLPEPAGPPHCPSVDRLFESVAMAVGRRACGVVLTGMGQDGRAGAASIRRAGGLVLAESADTAVVYGMPLAAAESGAVDEVLPLGELPARIARFGAGE